MGRGRTVGGLGEDWGRAGGGQEEGWGRAEGRPRQCICHMRVTVVRRPSGNCWELHHTTESEPKSRSRST